MIALQWLFHNNVVHPICGIAWFAGDVFRISKLIEWADWFHEESAPQ